MHVGATLLWSNGRRANLECGFDRAAVQFCEVLICQLPGHTTGIQ